MMTLFGGLIFLKENQFEGLKIFYFILMTIANLAFFVLWFALFLKHYQKYVIQSLKELKFCCCRNRLIRVLIPVLMKLSRYREVHNPEQIDAGHEENDGLVGYPSVHPEKREKRKRDILFGDKDAELQKVNPRERLGESMYRYDATGLIEEDKLEQEKYEKIKDEEGSFRLGSDPMAPRIDQKAPTMEQRQMIISPFSTAGRLIRKIKEPVGNKKAKDLFD